MHASEIHGLSPRPITWFPLLVMMLAVSLVMASIVRRIRRLALQVGVSAREHDRIAVDERGSDEIADLARAFNAARQQIRAQLDQLQRREQTLRMTMSDTSHDVMVPLTVLRLQLEQLRQQLEDSGSERVELVGAALEEAHYLTALVQNLAVAARLDAGAPELVHHPVDLNALVARVLSRHRALAAQRQVCLEGGVPDHPVWIEGDVTMIEQAVNNVVHNAIRFNRHGGHVAVVLDDTPDRGFVLRVLDDGPGIPEGERARLLERSFRGTEARRLEPDGRGLGLAITRRVAAAHGWRLSLDASEAGGLEVTLCPSAGGTG
jgi:signal transduction histidine kinase